MGTMLTVFTMTSHWKAVVCAQVGRCCCLLVSPGGTVALTFVFVRVLHAESDSWWMLIAAKPTVHFCHRS